CESANIIRRSAASAPGLTRKSAVTAKTIGRENLFRRRIVARLGVDLQWRQSLRWHQLHPDFTPFTIVPWILWTVTQHILVAQLDANFCGHIRQVVRVINGESPPPGQLRDIAQQAWPQ